MLAERRVPSDRETRIAPFFGLYSGLDHVAVGHDVTLVVIDETGPGDLGCRASHIDRHDARQHLVGHFDDRAGVETTSHGAVCRDHGRHRRRLNRVVGDAFVEGVGADHSACDPEQQGQHRRWAAGSTGSSWVHQSADMRPSTVAGRA
ncbi:MAG: hypothetical protein WKF73_01765 [Nocardioidaceae bacterium]